MDHGHPEANEYPLGVVWEEAQLVIERLNGLEATRALLTQMAVASLFSKDGQKTFQSIIKRMGDGWQQ